METRDSNKVSDASSHTNYRYLHTPEMLSRMRNLQHEKRLAEKKVDRLSSKVAELIERDGIILDEKLSSDLLQTVNEERENRVQMLQKGSFNEIFWNQQMAASKKSTRGMKWHPLMIRWCLYIQHLSSKTYETLRKSGLLLLPSQRTLRDYSHCIKSEAGFSSDVDRMLAKAANVESATEPQRMVCLLILFFKLYSLMIYADCPHA